MDTRTREKYRAQVRVMLHLLEGHRSRLPAGKPLSTALADGMAAAQALGFDLLTRGSTGNGWPHYRCWAWS